MFGIEFDGHPALTRILMPDDWPGHPQRKDYPLGGIPSSTGRHHPAAGPAEVLQLMSTTEPHMSQTDIYATSGADSADSRAPTSSTRLGATGTELVDEAALHEERIVVNMGPQHPSTHGVLRLILELDGETVTETRAGIGYLHTGIEKNMEFRTWTQGATFCTRMDYLTPIFNDHLLPRRGAAARHHRRHPRARQRIRVLLMELNRISSHLVALATGGMEMGATTVMTVGFQERERILSILEMVTGLRMNHAYIRPGGVAQDLPGCHRQGARHDSVGAQGPWRARAAAQREPHPQGPHRRRRLPRPHRLHGAGHHGAGAALDGPAPRPAQAHPYCGYETYDFEVITRTEADAYARLRIRIDEMYESLKIAEQAIDRLQGKPGPVMVADKKIALAGQLAIGSDGLGNSLDHIREIMGTSMESLIHHSSWSPRASGSRRARRMPRSRAQGRARLPRRLRRRDAPLPGALPRPVVQQPAGHRRDV